MAMSAYRNYTNNVSAMKKNLEKLSSGYKINRAGDDAAGLAISEKMRAQITGLETAQKNAKDGISLVQTAEGALTEVHDMLNRMVELATMSANGTYDNTTDREQLQKEMDQLKSEINRISRASNFNGIQLLDGSLDGESSALSDITVESVTTGVQGGLGAATGAVYKIDLKDLTSVVEGKPTASGSIMMAGTCIGNLVAKTTGTANQTEFTLSEVTKTVTIAGIGYDVTANGSELTLTAKTVPTKEDEIAKGTDLQVSLVMKGTQGGADGDKGTNHSYDLAVHVDRAPQMNDPNKVAQGKFTLDKDQIKDGAVIRIGTEDYTFAVGKDSKIEGANVIDLKKYEEGDEDLLKAAYDTMSKTIGSSNKMFDVTTDGTAMYLTEKIDTLTPDYKSTVDYTKDWDLHDKNGWNSPVSGGNQTGAVVQFGTKGKGLTLQIGDTAADYNQLQVNVKACNTSSLGLNGVRIDTQEDAQKAVDAIKKAINTVSDVRGGLGATQNRLEHTINNLSVMTENIQDAESTIRDTDVAEEMMAYTKNNILIQSAQAMLAQANQVPQGVLQLLQ